VVGAAYSPFGYRAAAAGDGHDSYAEVLGRGGGSWPMSFTWSSELRQLPACERAGDTCPWAGSPLLTAAGLRSAGTAPAAAPSSRPRFAVSVSGQVSGSGRVSLTIKVGGRLAGVRAVAHLGATRVRLAVRRRSSFIFTAAGKLTPGRWNVTIRYRTSLTRTGGPVSRMVVTVPSSA
jgi:hypothetical protein